MHEGERDAKLIPFFALVLLRNNMSVLFYSVAHVEMAWVKLYWAWVMWNDQNQTPEVTRYVLYLIAKWKACH